MAKNYRPLSENSEAYKTVASTYDRMCSPGSLIGDMVLFKVPYEFAFFSHQNEALVLICRSNVRKNTGREMLDSSIKRYLRHYAAKRKEEYEALVSMGFARRLWYFITTL